MEIQEIEIVVGKDGQVELTVRGVKGSACLDITRSLEAALGGKVLTREMTPEAQEDITSIHLDQEQALDQRTGE